MRVAPASRAFSTSSLTTEDGRSTTSPAAICDTRRSGRIWMRGMGPRFYFEVIPRSFRAACAAARRAMGMRNGEQET